MLTSRQAPAILNSLLSSGMDAMSAFDLHNQLGQCQAKSRTNGEVTFDYTRPSMRLITPETEPSFPPGPSLPPPTTFPPRNPPPPEEPGPVPPTTNPLPPEFGPQGPQGIPGAPGDPGNPWRPRPVNQLVVPYMFHIPEANWIGLKADDERRHAVWPGAFNTADRIGSVDFRGFGSPGEHISLNIDEGKDTTDFTVNLLGEWWKGLRLARTTAEHNDNISQDVDFIYEDSCLVEGSGDTVEAVNRLGHKIPSGAFVIVALAKNGCWHIIMARGEEDCRTIGGHDFKYLTGYDAARKQWVYKTSSDCVELIDGYDLTYDRATIAGEDMTAISGRAAGTFQLLAMDSNNELLWVSTSECP